jgi:hypothetical protein
MLSYILLELNLLLYNVPVLEVFHPERQPKHAVLKKIKPLYNGTRVQVISRAQYNRRI